MKRAFILPVILLLSLAVSSWLPLHASAAGATTSVHIIKYAVNGSVAAEATKSYQWLCDNLPVQGDGVTHYYHQGPVFEGDRWDPDETQNLKDKGAVRGTAVKDLCELVGGMSPGDEITLKAIDGWQTKFAYENIYEPLDIQGVIALCWHLGEDALSGETYGGGYPGNSGYNAAMQIIFMAGTANRDGKHVFGNSDMRICFPDEKYQYFYDGLPSTNGLSGKWISEIMIYPGEAPVPADASFSHDLDSEDTGSFPTVPVILGAVGLAIIVVSVILLFGRKAG